MNDDMEMTNQDLAQMVRWDYISCTPDKITTEQLSLTWKGVGGGNVVLSLLRVTDAFYRPRT